jgi:hypothetical protein
MFLCTLCVSNVFHDKRADFFPRTATPFVLQVPVYTARLWQKKTYRIYACLLRDKKLVAIIRFTAR